MWAWGGGICDIPPKVNLPLPRELKNGFRQHRTPGQLQFYVSVHGAGQGQGRGRAGAGQGQGRVGTRLFCAD